MEKLIPVINRLQDVFHSVGMLDTIDLPQIAVVGSQSSGKSSVLEAFVGRDFLPRGTGIVTRRPLVLQLIQTSSEKKSDNQAPQEWGEFLHLAGQKFTNFQEIKEEIATETDRVTGKTKNVSPLPIHLKVYSPHVVNLTLIDLPGMTKVPVGDQPKDIEYQIRKMITHFISKPNCIILAVSAANTDIANSDALKIAREVDPKGERTVGVITKLDLMDSGTDAMDILSGQIIPLKRGYIGIVNRSQSDINSKKTIKDARESEAQFFQRHPSYKSIADRCGTTYLAKSLNNMLLDHIRACLPEIKSKITSLIIQAQQRLNEYGTPLDETTMSHGALLLQMLTKFSTDFTDVIDGKHADLSTNELFGGARINHIFLKKYTPYLSKVAAADNLTEHDIKTAIRNAKGPRTSLFIPEASFEMLVRRQVKLLEDPSLHCVDQVYDELKTIVEHCEKNLARFPNLKERVKDFVIQLLKDYTIPLKDFIRNLINIEIAYINTNHPDFYGGGRSAMALILEKMAQQSNPNTATQQSIHVPQQPPKGRQQPQQPPPPQVHQQPEIQHPKQKSKDEEYDEWFQVERPANSQSRSLSRRNSKSTTRSVSPSKAKAKKTGFLEKFFGGSGNPTPTTDPLGVGVASSSNPPENTESKQSTTPSDYDQDVNSMYSQEQLTHPTLPYPSQYDQDGGMSNSVDFTSTYEHKEKMETEIIRALLTSYFDIIKKNISDSVPKSIMHFLVNQSKLHLQSELVRNLYKDELFDDLLKENEEIANKRKATQKMLKVLYSAQDVINEVRDLKL